MLTDGDRQKLQGNRKFSLSHFGFPIRVLFCKFAIDTNRCFDIILYCLFVGCKNIPLAKLLLVRQTANNKCVIN